MDSFGTSEMLDLIYEFREKYGDHFEPAQMLKDYAKDPSRKFHIKWTLKNAFFETEIHNVEYILNFRIMYGIYSTVMM